MCPAPFIGFVDVESMLSFETFDIVHVAGESFSCLWGYLDPGMGSMAFQVLLASVLSASFFVKSWIQQARRGVMFKTKKS
jgi:hypothetical protein